MKRVPLKRKTTNESQKVNKVPLYWQYIFELLQIEQNLLLLIIYLPLAYAVRQCFQLCLSVCLSISSGYNF